MRFHQTYQYIPVEEPVENFAPEPKFWRYATAKTILTKPLFFQPIKMSFYLLSMLIRSKWIRRELAVHYTLYHESILEQISFMILYPIAPIAKKFL